MFPNWNFREIFLRNWKHFFLWRAPHIQSNINFQQFSNFQLFFYPYCWKIFLRCTTHLWSNISVISIIFKIFKFKFLGNFYPNSKKIYTFLYEQCNFNYFHCLQIDVWWQLSPPKCPCGALHAVGQIQWQFLQAFN